MKSTLTFHGGVGSVTGSNFLLDVGEAKILIDCGLFQGDAISEGRNNEPFAYNPSAIDTLFVTHAHLDHAGRIPKLIRDGFKGKIISTPPTKDLAELMLRDSLDVFRKGEDEDKEGLVAKYNEKDIERMLSLWHTVDYHEEITLPGGVTAELKNTGHILGSAMVELTRGGKTIVFTGDFGNFPDPILPDAEPILDTDYLVMESVYGDRLHEGRRERKERLEDIIEETAKAKGILLLPVFSIERAQEMLFEIKTMMEKHRVPTMPVFLDSPLAIHATDIYIKHRAFLKKSAQEVEGPDGI